MGQGQQYYLPGELPVRAVTTNENLDRRNYQQADYVDYLDMILNRLSFMIKRETMKAKAPCMSME